jgi:hypothetical protein
MSPGGRKARSGDLGKKDLSFSIGILICTFLFQLIQTFMFHDMYYTLEYVFRALGGFLVLVCIPLLAALTARFFLKMSFWRVLWKWLLIIAIPLTLVTFYGAYRENCEKKYSLLPRGISETVPLLNPYWIHSPKLASFKTGYPLTIPRSLLRGSSFFSLLKGSFSAPCLKEKGRSSTKGGIRAWYFSHSR